jgi:NAD(P)-dependent dehydrogenase (short-subunit alcohol dehydrogenase family)
MKTNWTTANIPSQAGRRAVITGANSGIGFEAALALAGRGADLIRRLAERVWATSQRESRVARTVVLKLKTKEFNIHTRSHTPNMPPSSCEELVAIALSLRERVDLGPHRLYRLVGVGVSNFREPRTQTIAEAGSI